MPSLKHRLDRFDALIAKPPEPPPEVYAHWRRVKKVWNLNLRLLDEAWPQFAEEEQQAIIKAWETWLEGRTGKLAPWLGSLGKGTSRLPRLAPEAMAGVCRAWLSPEVGSYRPCLPPVRLGHAGSQDAADERMEVAARTQGGRRGTALVRSAAVLRCVPALRSESSRL
jgi:hypothetical protein